jgi:hypothetical protein
VESDNYGQNDDDNRKSKLAKAIYKRKIREFEKQTRAASQ